jgi:cathepsin L
MACFSIITFAAVASVLQSVHALLLHQHAAEILSFDAYVKAHGKGYKTGSQEYNRRKAVYDRRVEGILEHNSKPKRLWTAGINHLSDATDEEFKMRFGWRHQTRQMGVASPHVASLLDITPPESHHWMNLSMASHVPDQGACGSCWAVAAAMTLEANFEIAYGYRRTFSAQEFVDCVSNPLHCGGKGGCDGATVELAMDWAVYNGLKTLEDSEYMAQETECKSKAFRKTKAQQGELDDDGRLLTFVEPGPMSAASLATGHGDDVVKGGQAIGLSGFTTLPANKERPLVDAVLKGPVGVTVAASGWGSYASGIFTNCDPTVNHAVLLMGYGKDANNQKYWLVRNSWGHSWGEKGFIRLFRADDEESVCGTDQSPMDGVSCDGGPTQVKVCGTCGILYDNVVPHFDRKGHTAGGVFKQN